MVVMLSSFKDGLLRIFIWENERVRTKVLHKQFDNENYGTTTRYDKHINTYLTYHRHHSPLDYSQYDEASCNAGKVFVSFRSR
jgi:hypothetical protein